MKIYKNLYLLPLLILLQSGVCAGEPWSVTEKPTLDSLLAVTLRSALTASAGGNIQARLGRIRLRQSAARHAEPEQLGRLLTQLYETVDRLPIDEAAPLHNLRQKDVDQNIEVLLRQQPSDALASTRKVSWKLAIIELLVEVEKSQYKDLTQELLGRAAIDRRQATTDRARALAALARGFQTGEVPTEIIQSLTENVAGEDYDMQRLQLGVLGQVGNAETLRFLKAARDTSAFDAVRENVEFAIGKLSYALASDRAAQAGVLRAILGQEAPTLRLLINWAIRQVVQDHHRSLLGVLEERLNAYETSNKYLAQEFQRAIDTLRR